MNPQLVVAAVSQAYEGTLVNADWPGAELRGALLLLRRRGHAGRWRRSRTAPARTCRGRTIAFALPDGNAATSVVWNPVRQLFVAAVRYHGYYQSADGITWTRMAAQPGAGLMTSAGCARPIRRHGVDRLPHLSRRAGGESADRRHLCLDGGRVQPGPGNLAGPVRGERRRLHQPDDHLCPAVEHGGAGDEHRAGPGHDRERRLQPGAGRGSLRAGHACCWPGPTICGRRNCPYSQGCAWRNTTNSTAWILRAGGRIPARAGLECEQSAGDFCGQRQRAVALDRRHRRERARCARRAMPLIFRI